MNISKSVHWPFTISAASSIRRKTTTMRLLTCIRFSKIFTRTSLPSSWSMPKGKCLKYGAWISMIAQLSGITLAKQTWITSWCLRGWDRKRKRSRTRKKRISVMETSRRYSDSTLLSFQASLSENSDWLQQDYTITYKNTHTGFWGFGVLGLGFRV